MQNGPTVCGLNDEGVLVQDCVDGQWVDSDVCTGTDVCTNSTMRKGTTVCGLNDEGFLVQNCVDGQWVDSATCTDANDVCENGTTQNGSTVCGLNGEGVLVQDCVDGDWVDSGTCTGTDVCTNSTTRKGTSVCGLNDEGFLVQDCVDGQWVDSATCTDANDVCENGTTQNGSTVCGLNGEGVLVQDCVDGDWVESATCSGTDVCENGTTQDGSTACGLNDEGVLVQDCVDGNWVDSATCTGTDVCENGATQHGSTVCGLNDEGVLALECVDGDWVDSATCSGTDVCKNGTLATEVITVFEFQSTVSAVNGGGLPTGIAVDDTVRFTVRVPLASATPAMPAGGTGCLPGAVACSTAAWTIPASPYTLTYSSGYVQTGTIDHIEIIDGGLQVGGGAPMNEDDEIVFFQGGNSLFKATGGNDWYSGSIPADLATATSNIDQAGLFDTTLYLGDEGSWDSVHDDNAKPQAVTLVRSGEMQQLCAGGAFRDTNTVTFQSTVTLAAGAKLPSGIAQNDTVTFSVTVPVWDATSASTVGNGCNTGDSDCTLAAWTFPASPYTLTYSSGYVQHGLVDRIELAEGGGDGPNDDKVDFYFGSKQIFQVVDFGGAWLPNGSMAADLFVPFSDIDRSGLFEVTFYWGSWGNWGTYHYDYTKPQGTTLVTKTP